MQNITFLLTNYYIEYLPTYEYLYSNYNVKEYILNIIILNDKFQFFILLNERYSL